MTERTELLAKALSPFLLQAAYYLIEAIPCLRQAILTRSSYLSYPGQPDIIRLPSNLSYLEESAILTRSSYLSYPGQPDILKRPSNLSNLDETAILTRPFLSFSP